MAIVIPDFERKLDDLLAMGRNPKITTRKQLADQMGVSEQSITNWAQTGLPEKRLRPFCYVFTLDPAALMNFSLKKFQRYLQNLESYWTQLLNIAQEAQDEITLIDVTETLPPVGYAPFGGERGLMISKIPTERLKQRTFHRNQCIRIQIQVPDKAGWHTVVLLKDQHIQSLVAQSDNDFACLDPQGRLELPMEQPYYRFDGVLGEHTLLVILTRAPWPPRLLEYLTDPDTFEIEKRQVLSDLHYGLGEEHPKQDTLALRYSFDVQ